ncbi:MAG: hypothetical protein N2255_00295 [Kiritimatiellae bacterium]|nr:hypothetical protein [Kiritimatiellia bacterium]
MLKKILLVWMIMASAMVLASWASAAEEETVELTVHGVAMAPHRSEDWASAGGCEVQVRFWQTQNTALALAVGAVSWEAVSEYAESDDGQTAVATRIDGSVKMLPVGFSLLYREEMAGRATLALEGGLRYAFCEPRLNVRAAYATDTSSGSVTGTIDLDNTLLALVAMKFEFGIGQAMGVTTGLGYQFDLFGPEERFLGRRLGDTSFNGALATLGLTVRF